jgi:hypothetical protein
MFKDVYNMENTTRISDLPDNISIQMPANLVNDRNSMGRRSNEFDDRGSQPLRERPSVSNQEEPSTTYAPINVHPNPYGNSIQPTQMSLPEFQNSNRGQGSFGAQQLTSQDKFGQDDLSRMADYLPKEQIRLPSRDIPMDQSMYQQDEEIQPNYIPRPKLTGDYIKEYEVASEKKILKHEKSKQTTEELDAVMTDIQIPLFVTLLFFLFNMPFLNMLLFKYFKILPIFHADGNINFYGILLKSSLFGFIFWTIQRAIKFLLVV